MNYKKLHSEQLDDERWLKKRQKILARDLFVCTQCGTDKKLEVHHLYYVHEHKLWQYPNNALVTLCHRCHGKWHRKYAYTIREKIWNKKKEYKPITKKQRLALIPKCKRPKKVSLAEQQDKTIRYRDRKKII